MNKTNIYQQRENAIPFDTTKRLIIIPLILMAFVVFLPDVIGGIAELLMETPEGQLVSLPMTFGMVVAVFASVFLMTKFGKITIGDLGLGASKAFAKVLTGIISGFIAISLVALIINVLGGANTTYNFKSEYTSTLAIGLVYFAFQGTYEELVYRSYLMPHFSKKMGIVWSILITSVLFTLLHALNPGMTVIPVVNLMLASVVFSLVYYVSGSLWLVGFAHGVWNYSQGFIYGSLVSGNHIEQSVLKATPAENMTLISGGDFGFEGGLITSAIGVVIIIVLITKARKTV